MSRSAPSLSAAGVLRRSVTRHAGPLSASFLFLALWQVCESLVPALIGVIIDRGVVTRDGTAFLLWCGALAVLFLVLSLSYRFGGRIGFTATQEEMHLLRIETAAHVLHPQGARTGLLPGETLSLATSDAQQVSVVLRNLGYAIASAVAVVVSAVLLLRIDPVVALVVLVGVPLTVALTQVVGPLVARRTESQMASIGRATGMASDFVEGVRSLKGTGGVDTAVARYREASGHAARASIRTAGGYGQLLGLSAFLSAVLLAVVTTIAGLAALREEISVGDFVAVVGLTVFLAEPIRALSQMGAEVSQATASARRVASFLDTPRLASVGDAEPGPDPRLELVDVALPGLDGFSLATRPGELVAVVVDQPVASDALVDLLRGERVPTSGEVRLGRAPLHALTTAGRRRSMLVVGHRVDLFEGTLRSNIDPGETLDDEAWRDLLESSAAADVVALAPEGLDQHVAAGGSTLSGGQRQRVALARALARTPGLLVLQDPTTAVDTVTEQRIARGLREMRHAAGSAYATVVLTSNPALLDQADRVLFVHEGRLHAEGHHRDLLADPAYARTVLR